MYAYMYKIPQILVVRHILLLSNCILLIKRTATYRLYHSPLSVHIYGLAMVDGEVCSPVALAGRRTSSWPAGPGTELSAGAAVSQRTESYASPPDRLEPSPSQTDG